MPNWCSNVATLSHPEPKMIARLLKVADQEGVGILQEFIPCPAELLNDELVTSYADPKKQKVVDEMKAAAIAKYGFQSWYDWCIANWGTKWDLCECTATRNDDNSVTLTFDTAWAPPIDAYETLEGQGFEIEAFYYEPGMAFCGIYENGVADDYEIPGSSDEAAKVIPRAIDEMFNIVGQMEEWEADEA